MCGIAGIVSFARDATPDPERVRKMCDALAHRGPDAAGLWSGGQVTLGHRRLSIVDLEGGAQPMRQPEAGLCVSFNGEIYNHPRLRESLERDGRAYRTRSDTETILHLYARYGDNALEYLQGMFAFAMWDESRRRLCLARDRLGIKPLYWTDTGRELIFASEIKAILAAGVTPEVNRAVIPEYLANRFVAGRETFYRGIYKLPPGHLLTWSHEEGLRQRRWWWMPAEIDDTDMSFDDAAAEVRAGLVESIRSHLMSDVPLGLFLSGGLDSSGIAGLVRPMLDQELRTFSVGYAESDASELPHARLAAQHAGARHQEVVVSGDDFFAALPGLVWHEDEPIAFPSSVPLYFVSALARRSVKVVLTGEGADELFLGYNRYRVTLWNARAAALMAAVLPLRSRAQLRSLTRSLPRAARRYAERSFLALPAETRALFCDNFAVFSEERQADLWLDPNAGRDVHAEALRLYERGPSDPLARMSYADMQTYMVELLMKQDQMSMAASVESRVPFLDHVFVERMARLPTRYKLVGLRTKAVLRKALEHDVPPAILARKKMGFPTPLGAWLRGPFRHLVQELVLSPRALGRGLFRPEALRRLVAEHESGAAQHADRLWLLINLELWLRQRLDGETPPPLPVLP